MLIISLVSFSPRDLFVGNSLFMSVPHFENWIICSFNVKFLEFFVHFAYQFTVQCGVGEDLFPFCRLSFCLVDCILCLLLSFSRSYLLMVSQSVCATGIIFRKCSPVSMRSSIFPTFSSMRFSVVVFFLRSLIYLDLSFVHGYRYFHYCPC